jgi:hypothetical protein
MDNPNIMGLNSHKVRKVQKKIITEMICFRQDILNLIPKIIIHISSQLVKLEQQIIEGTSANTFFD